MRFLMTMLFSCLAVCSYAMKESYQAGEQYAQGGVALGNPNQWDDGFLARNKDVGHLTNMNDTTLSDQGSDAYRTQSAEVEAHDRAKSAQGVSDTMAQSGSNAQSQHGALQTEAGNLLTISEVRKIDATNEHKIDPNDQFYKDSLAIESNPLSKTGGVEVKRKTTVTKETMESCEEGVAFAVDMVNQLTFVPPPRQTQQVDMTISFPGCITTTHHRRKTKWWKSGEHWVTYDANVPAINNHVAAYFDPQGHNIKKERIKSTQFLHKVSNSSVRVRYVHDTYQSEAGAQEHWSVITPGTEKLIQQHHCHEIKRQCLDAGNKHFDELVVTRPCWKWQVTYACQSQPLEGCKYLQDKGCYLKDSTCVDASIKPCAKWKRHYQCVTKTEVESSSIDDTELFCLDGNCHTPDIEKNTDMNQAIAQLAVFKEMQKQMSHDNPPSVFKGEVGECARHMINFTDCCSSMSGWGTSMGLSKCSGEEKALAGRKEKRLCHYVGTYCAEKMAVTGICLRKKSSYCCFSDKLARLLHEQGRPQLGRGWGSAENPDCGALSAHELQQIKLDQMDFSEIFQDLFKNIGAKALKAVPRQMQNQMPVAQKNIDVIRQQNNQNNGQGNVQKQVF